MPREDVGTVYEDVRRDWTPCESGEGHGIEGSGHRRHTLSEFLRVLVVVGDVATERLEQRVPIRKNPLCRQVLHELRRQVAHGRQDLGRHHERQAAVQPCGLVKNRRRNTASAARRGTQRIEHLASNLLPRLTGHLNLVLDPCRR